MSKLLIIVALMAAFLIIKHLINNPSRSKTSNDKDIDSENPNSLDHPEKYKKTVQCDYCGTHIPLSTAYKAGDRHYCDESHYEKGKN